LDDFGFRVAVEGPAPGPHVHHGNVSPNRFARGNRVDYSKTVRWENSSDVDSSAQHDDSKRKRNKSKKAKENESIDADESNYSNKLLNSAFQSDSPQKSSLQGLVDNDEIPKYMKDNRRMYPHEVDENEYDSSVALNSKSYDETIPIPPRNNKKAGISDAFQTTRDESVFLPPAPMTDSNYPQKSVSSKLPPLPIRRASVDNPTAEKSFKRPLIGSENTIVKHAEASKNDSFKVHNH
jgi:hypothetical protein